VVEKSSYLGWLALGEVYSDQGVPMREYGNRIHADPSILEEDILAALSYSAAVIAHEEALVG
jgi:hypothetical protein